MKTSLKDKMIKGLKDEIKAEVKSEQKKIGRKLTSEERKKIVKKTFYREARKTAFKGFLVGILGVGIASKLLGGIDTTALPEGNKQATEEQTKEPETPTARETFTSEIKQQAKTIDQIIMDIYNQKYPESKISDLGIIETNSNYIIEENNNGNIKYIYDRSQEKLEENQKYIMQVEDLTEKADYIGNILTLVDKKNQKVVAGFIDIGNKICDIEVNYLEAHNIKYSNNKENVSLEEIRNELLKQPNTPQYSNEAENVYVYALLEKYLEERTEQIENNNKSDVVKSNEEQVSQENSYEEERD